VRTEPSVQSALAELLAARGIPADSGESLRWVRVRMLGVPVVFPNFDARRLILWTHDVHHLLTGYDVTWRGEAEIGAFEIATSCKRYWAAWFFNLGGFLFGLFLAPRRTFRAFVRGRRCTNYYGADRARVEALPLAAARAELGLDRAIPPATWADWLWFVLWALAVISTGLALPVLAVWSIARAW
jgi:hypothetical protein